MSQFVETPTKTFTAGAAIGQHLRVTLNSSNKLVKAGVTDGDIEIGTIETESFADGDIRAVRLVSAVGTTKMVAAAAIVVGAKVWTAASGKISTDSIGAYDVGIAMEAAGANNDVIEVLRQPMQTDWRHFTAAGAIAQYARVKLTSSKLVVAALADGDIEIGTIEVASAADNDVRPVRLPTAPGATNMIAKVALAVGVKVFTAAAGKVSATASGAFVIGVALTSSSSDGDIIEVARHPSGAKVA